MSGEIHVDEDTKAFVREILSKNNFSLTSEVKYFPGALVGEGYGSRTIAVDIKDNQKTLHLFLKCALTSIKDEDFLKIYTNEVFAYKTLLPTYYKFLQDKGVWDGFRNAPKCYGVYEKRGSVIVAMENLKRKNFTLFNRFKCMNDKHLKLVLLTFAKFHAISFALKDQQRTMHDRYCAGRKNVFVLARVTEFEKVLLKSTNDFFTKLDPEEDSDILEKRDGLALRIEDQIMGMEEYLSEYSTFTKGDCWVNNTMILYEDENRENPIDIMLVDWQGITRGSPVHDIQSFFCSMSTEDTLRNYKYYLKVYHDELSKRIRELGSDPEILYPFSVLEQEWKKYGAYSFGLGLFTVKNLLRANEGPSAVQQGVGSTEAMQRAFEIISDNEEQYLRRGKYMIRHFIQIGAF